VLSKPSISSVNGSIINIDAIAITKINPHIVLINFDIFFCFHDPIIIAIITCAADENPPMNAFKNIATEQNKVIIKKIFFIIDSFPFCKLLTSYNISFISSIFFKIMK
jgi:hypothetical protein